MNLQQQIAEFRRLLAAADREVDDFELTAAGDGFRALMAGGQAELEVGCRTSGVRRRYLADGGSGWLEAFAADLRNELFPAVSRPQQ